MTEVRDWQEDMKMMEGTFEFDWTNNQDLQIAMGEALPYWLKQYKELEQTLIQTTASLVNAEAREKKLREAIEKAISHIGRDNHLRAFHCLLEEVFYPDKEEES